MHVIATFDGSREDRSTSTAISSATQPAGSTTLTTPGSASRIFIVGGDVDGSGNSASRLIGGLAVARIYSDPIGELDAYRLAVAGGFADDTVAPVVRAVTRPADHADLNVEYVAPDIEAIDDLDAGPRPSISVTGPDEVTAPLDLATRAFTPTVDGIYTLVVPGDRRGGQRRHRRSTSWRAATPSSPKSPASPRRPNPPLMA